MSGPTIDFDKLNEPHWAEDERERARLAVEFAQLLINNHDFAEFEQRFSDSPYLQHNPYVATGMPGLMGFTKLLTRFYPGFSYDVKRLHVDGDYVILHSHATLKSRHRGNDRKGLIIVDVLKIVDGRIVEHWDAIQPLDWLMRLLLFIGGGRRGNVNGVF